MRRRRRSRRSLNQRIVRGPIPRAAREVLAGKRLTTSEHWTDVWREEHATAFTAARMTREQLVEELHRELVKALEAGETMETFRARAQPLLERRGWAPPLRGGDVPTRLKRIYQTNMRTARASGRWSRIERRAGTMPYLVYLLGPSIEHRDAHVRLAGTILPVSDPFWSTAFPPNGWGCKCRTRQVTARERGRLLGRGDGEYTSAAPRMPDAEWTNPATGETRMVPEGIDPGWDYNPGRHRTLGIHRRDADRAEAVLAGRALERVDAPAREQLVRQRLRTSLAGPGFRHYLTRPRGDAPPRREAREEYIEAVPVAVVPEAVREAAGTTARCLYLTAPVSNKQWARHGPGQKRPRPGHTVPSAWWSDIQDILDTITPVHRPDGRWEYVDTARRRRLIIDIDGLGRMIVVSYHPRRP